MFYFKGWKLYTRLEKLRSFHRANKTRRMKGEQISGELTNTACVTWNYEAKGLSEMDVELHGNQRAGNLTILYI